MKLSQNIIKITTNIKRSKKLCMHYFTQSIHVINTRNCIQVLCQIITDVMICVFKYLETKI